MLFLLHHYFLSFIQVRLLSDSQHTRILNSVAAKEMRRPSVPKVPGSNLTNTLLIYSSHLHMQVAIRVYCYVKDRVTASKLDQPSLTPLSLAGCGLIIIRTVA